jgi:hypothetical protein
VSLSGDHIAAVSRLSWGGLFIITRRYGDSEELPDILVLAVSTHQVQTSKADIGSDALAYCGWDKMNTGFCS